MRVINDPLGQTHSHATILTWTLFCLNIDFDFETNRRTDTTCENSDHYRPWMWVGLVDHSNIIEVRLFKPLLVPLWIQFTVKSEQHLLTMALSSDYTTIVMLQQRPTNTFSQHFHLAKEELVRANLCQQWFFFHSKVEHLC